MTMPIESATNRTGVEDLTPARALIAEMIRRYWVLGIESTCLEIQKLGWFLERTIHELGVESPLNLDFVTDRYGPYSEQLLPLMGGLDGTYLKCDKLLSDAGPTDTIGFDAQTRKHVNLFFQQKENQHLRKVLDHTAETIDGFESPMGMELLVTVDWLIEREHCEASVPGTLTGLRNEPPEPAAAERKMGLFDERLVGLALDRISGASSSGRST